MRLQPFHKNVQPLPVDEIKVFLQVSHVDVAFAELQLSTRVVVNVVDTHLLHDAKASLREPIQHSKPNAREAGEDY